MFVQKKSDLNCRSYESFYFTYTNIKEIKISQDKNTPEFLFNLMFNTSAPVLLVIARKSVLK